MTNFSIKSTLQKEVHAHFSFQQIQESQTMATRDTVMRTFAGDPFLNGVVINGPDWPFSFSQQDHLVVVSSSGLATVPAGTSIELGWLKLKAPQSTWSEQQIAMYERLWVLHSEVLSFLLVTRHRAAYEARPHGELLPRHLTPSEPCDSIVGFRIYWLRDGAEHAVILRGFGSPSRIRLVFATTGHPLFSVLKDNRWHFVSLRLSSLSRYIREKTPRGRFAKHVLEAMLIRHHRTLIPFNAVPLWYCINR